MSFQYLFIPALLTTLLCSSLVYGMEPEQNITATKKSWPPLTQEYVDKHIKLAEQGEVQVQDELMDHFLSGRYRSTYLEPAKVDFDKWQGIQERYYENDKYANFILEHTSEIIIHRKFPKIFSSIIERAENKIPGAQYNLGCMCKTGLGVDKNEEEAWALFKLAAEQNYGPALNRLGYMYDYGQGVDRDKQKAEDCYQRSLKEGHANAFSYYFCRYGNRDYKSQDEKRQIFRLMTDAADQGIAFIQGAIAEGCRAGYSGMDQHHGLFLKYAKLAAAQGEPTALTRLAQEIWHTSKDEKQAIPFHKLGAMRGNWESQVFLAWMYADGKFFEKNLLESFRWHLKSGWNKGPSPTDFLAEKFSKPTGEVQDFQELVKDIIGDGAKMGEESGLVLLISHHQLQVGLNSNSGFGAQACPIEDLKDLHQSITLVAEEAMGIMQSLQTAKYGLLTGLELTDECKAYLPDQCEPLFFSLDKIGDRNYLTVVEDNVPLVAQFVKFYGGMDAKFDQAADALKRLANLYKSGQDRALTKLTTKQCLAKASKEDADVKAFEKQKKKYETLKSLFSAPLEETTNDLALLNEIREKIKSLPSRGVDSQTKYFLKKNPKMAQYY